ncbi:STAS domain-containing protein [Crossiella sp. CA198]|uniref:STAS domain-containing protein n=1 Tax=Crossiella sp. CA198 TaxID=3455607 RepID=UPI003F8D4370
MSSELACQVDQTGAVAVVRPHGVLRVNTASALRGAVAKCLAEQPAAVLLELTGLRLGDEVALTVFPALSRRAAEWPGIPVALCSVPAEVFAPMARIGLVRYLTVFAGPAEALAALADRPRSPVLREWYLPEAGACRQAREAVGQACATWRVEELAEAAVLVANELVANAVSHAGTALQLTVAMRGSYLCLSVRDGSAAPPVLARRPARAGGQGLVLISKLATAWGHLSAVDGKVVWATLRVRQPGAGRNGR